MNKNLIIAVILILVSFVWAGSFIVVDITTKEMDPIDLGFLRFLVATPLMILIAVLRKKPLLLPKKELPWLVVLGLTGVTLLYLFQFLGIHFTNAPTASVLINTNVIFIAILSGLFLHETLTRKRVAGIVLSFIGVFVIMFSDFSKQELTFDNLFFIGGILMLLSALCWALYSFVGKRLLKTYDEFVITTYAFGFGTLFYIPFVVLHLGPVLQQTSLNGWLAVLYLALTCSIFGYLGWYYALKRIDASKAAVFLNFIPLFTILMSFFLGTSLTWFFLLGAALIIYGVYLTQKT
ncbi:MAG: DMT family transporter [Thermoplasmata archaeon]|nr:DMT family transporter [Thermoplasmata archaeon]MBE3141648.1 DMT family transporter [Thermoplasmata archaeon]